MLAERLSDISKLPVPRMLSILEPLKATKYGGYNAPDALSDELKFLAGWLVEQGTTLMDAVRWMNEELTRSETGYPWGSWIGGEDMEYPVRIIAEFLVSQQKSDLGTHSFAINSHLQRGVSALPSETMPLAKTAAWHCVGGCGMGGWGGLRVESNCEIAVCGGPSLA